MSQETCTIAARGVPVKLREAADTRAAALGMSRSRYLEHLVATDCARVGLWLPVPESVQSVGTPVPTAAENSRQQGGTSE